MNAFEMLYPEKEFWSLSTALIWISYRSIDNVEEFAPDGFLECNEDSLACLKDAATLLWPHLISGRVRAQAEHKDFYTSEVKTVEVPANDWKLFKLSLALEDSRRGIEATASCSNNGLRKVLLPRSHIIDLWPRQQKSLTVSPGILRDELQQAPTLFLGQVVDWIMLQGTERCFETQKDFDKAYNSAERIMFERFHASNPVVRGINSDSPCGDETVPGNFWRLLADPREDRSAMEPRFHSVDDYLRREDGGVLILPVRSAGPFGAVEFKRYASCYVDGDFVRKHWPVREGTQLSPVGRPRKAEGAAAAFQKLFPNGKGRVSWKAVAKEVSDNLGQNVSIDTLKRALQASTQKG